MSITLERWIDDPTGVVDEMFAADGPASRFVKGYQPNRFQIEYAKLLARTAARGAIPETRGRVSAIEGDTGLGKSLAIVATVGMTAVLRRKPGVISTYTRFLNRQLAGKDGTAAALIVEAMTGYKPQIAVRRPRSAFASPKQCRQEAALLRQEALKLPADERPSLFGAADALAHLADWTEEELKKARAAKSNEQKQAFSRNFSGLIETFLEQNEGYDEFLKDIPYDHYTLDGRASEEEQAAFTIYKDLSDIADVVVVTHAAVIRSQSTWGVDLDTKGSGFSIVVADEANRLEDAGQAALGIRRSVSSYAREPELTQPAVHDIDDHDLRDEITALSLEQSEEGKLLLGQMQEVAADLGRNTREYRIVGNESWLDMLRSLHERSQKIVKLLGEVDTSEAKAARQRMQRRNDDIKQILETIRREALPSTGPGGGSHSRAFLNFSPREHDPSLQTRPKRGSKILSGLWKNEDNIVADAFVATSATLGTPGRTSLAAYGSMLESIGLTPTSPNVNGDLSKPVHMSRFGIMEGIVLAPGSWDPPSKPVSERENGAEIRSDNWLDNVAMAIGHAVRESWRPDGRSHVVVMCTSFNDAELIGKRLGGHVDPTMVHIRQRHESVDAGFNWLEGQSKAVLLSTGIWDGLDRPGAFDHLIIPALPFTPDEKRHADFVRDGENRTAPAVEQMMIRLRQGIGRGFRKKDDRVKLWILDSRIGLPPSILEMKHSKSKPIYLNAIPRRFERALENAVTFKPVEGNI